jgi:hypothetical protein
MELFSSAGRDLGSQEFFYKIAFEMAICRQIRDGNPVGKTYPHKNPRCHIPALLTSITRRPPNL